MCQHDRIPWMEHGFEYYCFGRAVENPATQYVPVHAQKGSIASLGM